MEIPIAFQSEDCDQHKETIEEKDWVGNKKFLIVLAE